MTTGTVRVSQLVSERHHDGRARSQPVSVLDTAAGRYRVIRTVTDAGDDTQEPALDVQGRFSVPLAELRDAHTATLPRHFG